MNGADSVMIPLLHKNDSIIALEEHLRQFAVEGLRTLVMAKRVIKEDKFNEWKAVWDQLSLSLDEDKDKKLEDHGSQLEKRLKLVGASAIEDRLQDGVPDAIKFLMNAHIRVWMLTGDKQETAIEIGKSCNLVQPFHTLVDLSSRSDEEFTSLLVYNVKKYELETKSIPEILEMRKRLSERMAIVIDGSTLAMALSRHKEKFFKMGLLADSCICCRVSPAQKAQVVELAKSNGPWITLAIGDGANDVNMIQTAHIGVGIIGKEGAQAVQSSDYALAQFRYLQKLLLVHGRWGYRRISLFICYYFYKNVAVVFCELCYAFFNGFSGQIYVLDTLTMMFNAVWTSWPCMLTFILEQDLNAEDSFKHPIAYKAGQLRQYFSMRVFWSWMIAAMWHGFVSLFLPFAAMAYAVDDDGRDTGLWWVSTLSFTLIIHIISFKMLMVSSYWNKLSLIGVVGGLGLYHVSMIFLNTAPVASRIQPGLNQLYYALMSRPKSWIVIFFVPIIALIPDFVLTSWNKIFHPTPVDNLMAIKRKQEELKKK
jgi:phospholipid-translocating P-type ATPase (flippase)